MQKLTNEVVVQLNDLPGFPARPNTVPPAPDRWLLGDWLVECHVNPQVVNFAALPASGNRIGDIRASLADQAWYIWDGAVWQAMSGAGGGVNSVTASAPLASSGGANPNISFPSWPADSAGSLTNDGAGNLSWTPASSPALVEVPATAQEVLSAGDLVRFVNTGSSFVEKADATNSDARLNPVGFAVTAAAIGAPVKVCIAGFANVPASSFDVAPNPGDVGRRVFVSTTSGNISLSAPTGDGDIVQRVGILVDGTANPRVLVQVGDPTLL